MAAIVSFTGAACAQGGLPPQVTMELEAMTKAKMRIGACAASLDGKELLSYQADDLYVPASNMKLLTSCFALARLGGDFRYTTTVYLSGNDVIVKGDYDPILGDPVVAQATGKSIYTELDLWAKCIVKRLGGQAAGNVIVIGRGGSYRHPEWPKNQYQRWYCAPIAELNFNDNCFDVRFNKSKEGGIVPVVAPESRFIEVVNNTRPGKGAYSLTNSKDQSQIRLSGTAAYNMTDPVSNAMDNPPLVLARVLADRIAQAGGKVEGEIKLLSDEQAGLDKAKAIIQTQTPLSLVMNRANKRSVNMIAEGMFLRAGDGTFDGSAQLEAQTLRETYGLAEGSFSISDGSGFSASNRVSPRAMVKLLTAVLKRKDSRVLLDALPVGGVDGTLSKRFEDAPYRTRVLGKTGYIAGVSALSGYVLDADGKPVAAYSVLVNRCADLARAKRAEEMVAKALVDWADGKKMTNDK